MKNRTNYDEKMHVKELMPEKKRLAKYCSFVLTHYRIRHVFVITYTPKSAQKYLKKKIKLFVIAFCFFIYLVVFITENGSVLSSAVFSTYIFDRLKVLPLFSYLIK